MTHAVTVLVLQLSALVLAALFAGRFFERVLRLPRVLGELAGGMIVGPFGLGRLPVPGIHQPLFPLAQGAVLPVSIELYAIAVLASIILLFLAGLETDLPTFLRFSGVAGGVGLGGVILSFTVGAGAAVLLLPTVTGFSDPQALFLGTLATATSVGITARILSEKRKMASPEGVTILAAAVLDDVIGIILLAIVVALAQVTDAGVDWAQVGRVALRAFGFWIGSTTVGILIAPYLVRGLKRLQSMELIAGVSFGLALLLAGVAETVGLAMIIGAYVMGLSLSRTDVADEVREQLHGLYAFLVPLFFAVMGLMVDFAAISPVLVFGLIFAVLGIGTKIVGCGAPALALGFNVRGAFRIGAGMLPRGEVTLIVAGIGLSSGAIGSDLFGVAVMTLLVSSIVAPPVLSRSLDGPSGYRRADRAAADRGTRQVTLKLPSAAAAEFLRGRIIAAFRGEGFYVTRVDIKEPIYRVRHDEINISLVQSDATISLTTPVQNEQLVRLVLIEELVELKALMGGLEVAAKEASDRLADGLLEL